MESRKANEAKRLKSHKIQRPNYGDEIEKCKRNLSLVQDNRCSGQKLKTMTDILVERTKYIKKYQDKISNKMSDIKFGILRKLQDLDLLSNKARKLDEDFLEKSAKRKLAISVKDKKIQLLRKELLNRISENAKVDTE